MVWWKSGKSNSQGGRCSQSLAHSPRKKNIADRTRGGGSWSTGLALLGPLPRAISIRSRRTPGLPDVAGLAKEAAAKRVTPVLRGLQGQQDLTLLRVKRNERQGCLLAPPPSGLACLLSNPHPLCQEHCGVRGGEHAFPFTETQPGRSPSTIRKGSFRSKKTDSVYRFLTKERPRDDAGFFAPASFQRRLPRPLPAQPSSPDPPRTGSNPRGSFSPGTRSCRRPSRPAG